MSALTARERAAKAQEEKEQAQINFLLYGFDREPVLRDMLVTMRWLLPRLERWRVNGIQAGPEGKDRDWIERTAKLHALWTKTGGGDL